MGDKNTIRPEAGSFWVHRRTGLRVKVLCVGSIEHSFPTIGHPVLDGEPAVIYEEIGEWKVRVLSEFMDGRYVFEDRKSYEYGDVTPPKFWRAVWAVITGKPY